MLDAGFRMLVAGAASLKTTIPNPQIYPPLPFDSFNFRQLAGLQIDQGVIQASQFDFRRNPQNSAAIEHPRQDVTGQES